MKLKKLLATAAAVTMFVTGCGGSQMDTAEIETLLEKAQNTMASVESMAAEMTMEMDMGMNGEVIETTTLANIRTQQEPLKMAMEMSMVMSDGTRIDQMQMYAVEEGGHLHTYMSMADMWYAETMELDAMNQYNAEENMDLYLNNLTDFKSHGQEKINDTDVTMISGVIKGDAMEKAFADSGMTASAESMGITVEMLEEIYDELADLPISLWIDAEGYVLKYEMDMTEMMQKVMDESMKAMGAAETELAMDIEKTVISMVCSDFNTVEEIVIPEAALGLSPGEHTHGE
ncbi:MAG: hypothetical protein IJA25_01740 [Anaerotignum sp.]|nr:hypothetical protein [Anaerotignum sp.]